MNKLTNCPDCGVQPGMFHLLGCDVERCPDCGGQQISCNCDDLQTNPRQPWDGEWPGAKECRMLGFWCRWGPGWIPCDSDHPDATEDLNRLAVHRAELQAIMEQSGLWNPFFGFFVLPVGPSRKKERIVREGQALYDPLREAAGYP
jgi:hypothetical protein